MHINTIHRRVAQTFLNYVHFRFTDRGSIMSQCCILYKTNYVPWINKKTHKKKNTLCFRIEPTITIGLTTGQFKKHSVTYIMGKALYNLPLIHPFTHTHSITDGNDGKLPWPAQGRQTFGREMPGIEPPTLCSVDDQLCHTILYIQHLDV